MYFSVFSVSSVVNRFLVKSSEERPTNRIYRSVWNEITRTFVAAAETVRGRGKPSSGVCTDGAMPPASRSGVVLARRRPMMLALEQRFMFDGAAAAPVAEAAAAAAAAEANAAVANAIADAPAPVEVRAADPAKDGGKKEVVFVDTPVADYQSLEAGIRDGVAIVEIDGAKDGLAQIAQWAQTNSGYDSISILGHGSAATLNLGTTTLTSASLGSSVVQTGRDDRRLAHRRRRPHALRLRRRQGERRRSVPPSPTSRKPPAPTSRRCRPMRGDGAASLNGDWDLKKTTGQIEASPQALTDFHSTLVDVTTGNDPGSAYSGYEFWYHVSFSRSPLRPPRRGF